MKAEQHKIRPKINLNKNNELKEQSAKSKPNT